MECINIEDSYIQRNTQQEQNLPLSDDDSDTRSREGVRRHETFLLVVV